MIVKIANGFKGNVKILLTKTTTPFIISVGSTLFSRTKRRLVATHRSDIVGGGMVFSSKPIPIGTMFQVKLLEKENRGGPLVSACME